MTARDIAHGRQGGRIVPFQQPPDPPACTVCGKPVYSGTLNLPATHATCANGGELDGQATLFDP